MITQKFGEFVPSNELTSSKFYISPNEYKVFGRKRVEIFEKFRDFASDYPRMRSVLIAPYTKIPMEYGWQNRKNYSITSPYLLNHLIAGGNYGLAHPSGMSIGIDNDNIEIDKAIKKLGDTTGWNTGTRGHFCNIIIIKDDPIGNIPLIGGGYIRGKGGQNVGPGSIHPNKTVYGSTYLNLIPPLEVSKAELLEAFDPVIIGKEKLHKKELKSKIEKPKNSNSLAMVDFVDFTGFKQSGYKFQGAHPIHGSSTGSNFVVDVEQNVWHCFRHGTGGGPLQWVAVATGIIDCAESVPGKIKGDLFWRVIAAAHNQFGVSFEKLVEEFGGEKSVR